MKENRKTVTGDDILYALTTLGFNLYEDTLKEFLKKHRIAVKASDKAEKNNGVEEGNQEEEDKKDNE